jgi:hypothetical protein
MSGQRHVRPERRPSYEPVTRLLQPIAHDPKMPRPSTTVTGAALVLLSALVGIASMVELAVNWTATRARSSSTSTAAMSPLIWPTPLSRSCSSCSARPW